MSLIENIKMAISSLLSHKLRSILTMLGIIIGVGSVIAIVAIAQGGEEMLKSQISGPGNTIELLYMPPEEELGNLESVLMSPFSQEDINIIESLPEVANVVATSSRFGNIRHKEDTVDASITGITQTYIEVIGLEVASGRNILSTDFLGAQRTAIISSSLQEELFNGEDLLGEIIFVNSHPIEIVGVLDKPTGFLNGGINEIYIPLNTWRNIFGSNNYSQVTIQANNSEDLQNAGIKAADQLNQLHRTEESYQIINMEEMATGIGQVTNVMTILIGSIAAISLFVGGIGVMNIMLVSVTERTREIGVRMSLGATRVQIQIQFLIEAITLTLIGGAIGIFIGSGSAAIVSYFTGWPSLISWHAVFGGLLFSVVIGVIFGVLPANKASGLDPIECLRHE
ncbi:ABC transporter [Gracilibacillus boraciitolerans JCM 21714]|uniref:ABC transporter n=1 Tax=Gracilibacillus boraciitolerans JCM 21714 TaxID=1298598 RepID=W4VQG3_9BACI|nr:ABC transporter permease [Gracilibacillus boraciitolerans]GAE95462.1 ABC transporter [Gracilibacillus boraciitolerans JCM 21714]